MTELPNPSTLKNITTVVHVILSLEIGGMEQVVVDLVKSLDRDRYVPVVICVESRGPLADELEAIGIRVIKLPPMLSIFSFLYPSCLIKAIREVGASVVHVHSGCWFKGAFAARICKAKKIIYTQHGATSANTRILKTMERIAAFITDEIITVSTDLAEQLRVAGHIQMNKVSVIINGINTERFSGQLPNEKSGVIRIGVIARLEPVKDHGTLLRAIRILLDEGVNASLDIVGDGSEQSALEKLALELGISDSVHFFGSRRDIPQLLADIDIFCLCSLSEGTSISILEAMAASKPVVATNVGGNPALIEDGVNGFLVPVADPLSMAIALQKLIHNKELCLTMGEENRSRVKREFSIEAMTAKYEKLYEA